MSAGDYLAGLAWFALTLGGTLGGTAILVRKRLAHLAGVQRLVAFAIVATGALLAVHLVPGMLGVLARGTVLAATVVWVVVAVLVPKGPPRSRDNPAPGPDGPAVRWAAALAAAAVLVFLAATAFNQLAVAPQSVDLVNFHLPGVALWIQSGSIWHTTELLPNVAPGAYPSNGDLVLLAAVLPWHDDFLAHLAFYPYYALTGLAVYALAIELGATRAWATLAGALVLAIPAAAVTALVASLVDPVMLATFAAGLLFLVRHRRTRAWSDLVLAGLGLGLAFGTKWYGVSAVAIVVAVWAVARLVGRDRPSRVGRELVAIGGLVLAAGGIWLLRNWIAVGNPFFPVNVVAFGTTIFAAPHDVVRAGAGSTILDYLGNWGPWGSLILPQLRHSLAAPAALIGLGTLAAPVLLVVNRGFAWPRGRGPIAAGLAAAVLLALAYTVTPYTAGGPPGQPVLVAADARYLMPALVLAAAVVVAALAPVGWRWGAALAAVVLIALADGLHWSSGAAGSLANLSAGDWAVGIGVIALGAATVAAARGDRLRLPSRAVLVAGAACAAGLIVAGGFVVQRHYNEHRYFGAEPALDWILHHAPSDRRVALAGVWNDAGLSPVLPAFGPRLGNEVSYVGRDRGGFVYRYRGARAFAAALRRGAYDLVVVGLGRPGAERVPERRWALEAGYRPIARSRRLELLSAPG
jgi:hypothetical protein